jgi:DnaJ-class molecular chaperone
MAQDYYALLGVEKNASPEEIKAAYRKLAMQHHPDRGGDQIKFMHIREAYDTLSNPETRSNYDYKGPKGDQFRTGFQGFDFRWSGEGSAFDEMEDIFRNMGFGNKNRAPRQNHPTNIAFDILLEDVMTGKSVGIEFQMSNGQTRLVTIDVPAGIESGQQIRYAGMGENLHPGFKPADLIVTIRVRNHPEYERHGDNILCEKKIDVFDLLLGCKTDIKTLTGKNLVINIPAGTQSDTVLSCKSEGLPNMKTKRKGDLLIRIKALIPKSLTEEQLKKIKEIKNGI